MSNVKQTKEDRTPVSQIKSLVSIIAPLGRHLRRRSAIYSFLAGSATTVLLAWVFVWYGLFAYPVPWKATDPNDPRFDLSEFRLTDYPTSSELGEALRAIIPIGMPKSQVDQILSKAGARVTPYIPGKRAKNPPNLYYYAHANYRSIFYDVLYRTPLDDNAWKAGIYYDEENYVERIVSINP